jgi:hypothetical protein
VIIWLDNGRDLSQSIEGPWNPLPHTQEWETYFFTVIVHHAVNIPARSQSGTPKGQLNPTISDNSNYAVNSDKDWRAAQNIWLLPAYRVKVATNNSIYSGFTKVLLGFRHYVASGSTIHFSIP